MDPDRPPLHVLMLLESTYPSPHGGGAEAQVRTLSKALRARGQRVTVLTPLTAAGSRRRIERVHGVAVCRLPYPYRRFIGGPWLWCRLFGFLWSRRRHYHAWHVHIAHHLGAACALLGDWLGIPVVVKVSGWWELEKGTLATHPGPLARIARRCLLRADAWQAISKRIAADLLLKGIPAQRIFAIPNAVDVARFRDLVRTPGSAPRFVFIGRLVPEKGLDILLDAFAAALPECPTAYLRIVGTGPLAGALQHRAVELGIQEQVEFTGHREDIETLLADADIGLLPSRIEGLSNTLLECMASGLPMIATRISGSEDVVRPGDNGWLFEPDDCAALAGCLADAAQLPPARWQAMGANARQAVERHAGVNSVVDRLMVLYRGEVVPVAVALSIVSRGS